MKRNTAVILILLALFALSTLGRRVTASRPDAVDPTPLSTPEYPAAPRPAQPQETQSRIAESAQQQIQALVAEKELRSPVQRKIDSQLLYAIKIRRGEAIATGVQELVVNVGADDAGLVTVDITAIIDDQLLSELSGLGIEVSNVFPRHHSLRAVASLDQLETIAGFAQVRFIQPKQEAMYSQMAEQVQKSLNSYWDFQSRAAQVRGELQQALHTTSPPADTPLKIGSVTSQGDTTHKAFAARGVFNTDGTGVKIGVLSDGVTNLATSQATGDLGPVTILAGQAGSGNEGTAMLEIIHDLAPGAQLFFATAGNGLPSFAQNIRDLRSAGCDIILDDVGYFVESPFQDGQGSSVVSTNNGGLATQAVNDVVASGALYFSAAANSGNRDDGTSGTWEGDFVDGGTLALIPGGKVHDFDPTATVLQYDTITASGGPINLHWSDPLGASANDYDLFVLNSAGTAVLSSSTNFQSGTQDPYEQVTSGVDVTNNRIVILQKTGAADRFLHLGTNRGRLSFSTEGETHGHNAASGGYGVAAVCAVCVFPSVFNSTNTLETFSSDGPRRVFFNGNGSAITPGNLSSTGGTVLQKPDITAADGVAVSGAGGFPTLFSGTSAAAPHAAAIAALLKSANPALTQSQIKAALTSTAIDIEGPGTDRDAGAGIVMPYAALQSLGPPVVGKAFLELSTISKTETCCNGDGFIDPGESGALTVNLNNTGLLDATSATATLTTSTTGISIVNGTSAYPNLASNGGGANTTPFSFSLSSSLPPDTRGTFTLTINYSGGHQPSQAWNFSVQFGHELLTNGSFETGDFTGWTVSTASTGGSGTPFAPWSVSPAGAGGYSSYQIVTTTPQAGIFDAWNGFDGSGPMEYRMYQDVTIPAGAMLNLIWKDRAQWNFLSSSTLPRTYDVQVVDPSTNAVLATLYSFSTGTGSGYHDSGWLIHGNSLAAYAGQTVRIFFRESIPQAFTGPGQIEFDSISLSNGPLPTPTPTPSPTPGPCPGSAGFTVNDNGDASDIAPGDGVCRTAGGVCTLRAAIQEANILVACGLFDINVRAVTGSISLATALPDIDTNINIKGPGANQLTVQRSSSSGTPDFRIFTISSGRLVTISGLTISNGNANGNSNAGNGGGIFNLGALIVNDCNIYGNSSLSVGGGIYHAGSSLTINNCNIGGTAAGQPNSSGANGATAGIQTLGPTVINGGSINGNTGGAGIGIGGTATLNGVTITNNVNTKLPGGGVAVFSGGNVNIVNCLIASNSGSGGGGGVNNSVGTLKIVNTTISGNTGFGGQGGGVNNFNATLTMTNVTISNNRASFGGGLAPSGSIVMSNTIVVGNFFDSTTTADDVNGPGINSSSSFNVVGSCLNNCGLSNGVNNNRVGVSNPGLGPLANNGGPTVTHALLPGSPAIDAGNNALALDQNNNPLTTDQRGSGFARIINGTVDIGAFEIQVPPTTVQFGAPSFSVNEGGKQVNITVARVTGGAGPFTVSFTTSDTAGSQNCNVFNSKASARCDYISAIGKISFAAGENLKIISILIIDDAYAEGPETFTVNLNNPIGAVLGTQSTATVTVNDNDAANGTNPIDTSNLFVRQHYLDFLSREPDPPGLGFWTGEIDNCTPKPQCTEIKRINVSAAFYLSIEFQDTGYFVERIYKAAYGSANGASTLGGTHLLAVPIVRLNEFLADSQEIGFGVVVNQGNWQQQLEINKQAFTTEFVQRSRFTIAFPNTMTPAQFVDTLNANAGNPLSQLERDQQVSDLSTNVKTRAQVLRAIAEDPDLVNAEFNRAFVLMQFFGYLRRNPNDPQDTDYTGYDFWLTKLNQFNGNFQDAEMVKAFISSLEYRQRFGP